MNKLEHAGYTDLSPLGEGCFGSVFLGSTAVSGTAVALKRLNGNVSPQRVLEEIRMLQLAAEGSNHRVPSLIDVFRDSVLLLILLLFVCNVRFFILFSYLFQIV